ncbi:MAG: hypothetical protein GY845_25805 [Planctomycetes bacterium]|nr:hypothetical protein [Planctomycetota bacterium]
MKNKIKIPVDIDVNANDVIDIIEDTVILWSLYGHKEMPLILRGACEKPEFISVLRARLRQSSTISAQLNSDERFTILICNNEEALIGRIDL